jgi:hypothetical protein
VMEAVWSGAELSRDTKLLQFAPRLAPRGGPSTFTMQSYFATALARERKAEKAEQADGTGAKIVLISISQIRIYMCVCI